MISFYPGPSKVYEEVPAFVKEAYDQGILSINHRSREFASILKQAHHILREKLHIPQDYSIFFVSSATECWEIIAQSLIQKNSFHIFNGAFGEKWHYYTHKLGKEANSYEFEKDHELMPEHIFVPENAEVICLTQNETSNGTEISNEIIKKFRQLHPEKLLAIDATSSMAGIYLDISQADIWYASVQKCFGLPAGMAVLICSPAAIKKAFQIGEKDHYNSLTSLQENYLKLQTTHTPNVLNIYLLLKVMETTEDILKIEAKIEERFQRWENYFTLNQEFSMFIHNKKVRSKTVVTIQSQPELIQKLKTQALKEGILLGNGYGSLKDTTFRIANFPAINDQEIIRLKTFLKGKLS